MSVNESPVRFSVDSSIASVTLNRPDHANSINLDMAQALLDIAIRCDADSGIRCVVLTGAGRMFCAGGDLAAFADAGERMPSLLSRLAGTLHLAISRFARMPKPLLVLVNGPAAGAGMSIALLGDVVLAADSAHFTVGYLAVGLSPDGGLTWLLPRLVGLRKAQDLILSNRRVLAAEAEFMGLVTRVLDGKTLAEEGAATAQRLSQTAVGAVGLARNLLLESSAGTLETHLEREARAICSASAGYEGQEGVAAFVAKRKPRFEGGQ
jgi:2-(1,2-epoxy-1,2-dihydrophenyl)acetyl-CoA isomerase